MKQCPYCKEDIQVDAKKCRHCGEWLDEKDGASIDKKEEHDGDGKSHHIITDSMYNGQYGGFRTRVIATIIDYGFITIPLVAIFSLICYFSDGQSLGYRVMGLYIRDAKDENKKPNGGILFLRYLAKGPLFIVAIGVLWLMVSLIFYIIQSVGVVGEITLTIKNGLNWLLGLLGLLTLMPPGLGWITVPFNSKRQGLHDKLVKTVVIDTGRRQTGWMIVGIILAVLAPFILYARYSP